MKIKKGDIVKVVNIEGLSQKYYMCKNASLISEVIGCPQENCLIKNYLLRGQDNYIWWTNIKNIKKATRKEALLYCLYGPGVYNGI